MVDKVRATEQIIKSTSKPAPKTTTSGKRDFDKILQQKIDALEVERKGAVPKIKFSAHAQNRLKVRNIALTPQDMIKIEEAVNKAAEKGSRDSLLLMDNIALIVSVKNRTVITAVDESSMKGNVFTNIDSAVIM